MFAYMLEFKALVLRLFQDLFKVWLTRLVFILYNRAQFTGLPVLACDDYTSQCLDRLN